MDIGLQLGGCFLSSFLGVLFDRMAKPAFLNLFREPKYDVRGLLKKLKWKLLILQPVLDDAENKQTKDPAVKEWLEELQDVAYQADDLLDEINTEALRMKIESQHQSPIDQVSTSKDTSNFSTEFLEEIMPRIQEVVDSLEEFVQLIHVLGLVNKGKSKKLQFRLPSTSLVDETDVYGRDTDKETIIEELLSDGANTDNITVISIVGPGGIGKTTVAQFVYNDKRVEEHFDVKAWACISEEYDAIRITKVLLQELNIPFKSEDSFNSVQVKLKQGLSVKRFLLVLDDVWNREYSDWLTLSTPFNGAKEGSMIIVTTRDENVALMMCNGSIHHLDFMSEEYCWLLFKKHAMHHRNPTRNLEFESIAKDILRKCGGLPLAVKAIAGVLRSKETVEEWKEILRSYEWEETKHQTGILPSLRLSFNHLPPQLKGCFAYCAVFHKDYPFSKNEVVLLWMANGLLDNPKSNKRLEDRGDEFFRELRLRSLFQRSSDGNFSMHDLVNDLAKFVSGKYVYRQEDHWQHNTSLVGVRHFSYLNNETNAFEKFKLLHEAKFLRTFLPINLIGMANRHSKKLLHEILPTFKSLRILSLSYCNITELPNFVTILIQLRFLNLSYTKITKLPSRICALYNLQTLLLANCFDLCEFPKEMEKLINLRHLDLNGVRLSKMPMQIERLKGLQFLILSTYTVGTDGGSRIENLGKLGNLHRALSIYGLENVANGKAASMAGMKDKKHIKQLSLNWSDDSNGSQEVRDVLENLQPHLDIEDLEIVGYCGTRFSNWLENSSYCHMTSLYVSNCAHCFCLPALGQLPSLKYLTIRGLGKVLEMGEEIYGDASGTKPFPCLERLKIEKMHEWRKWHIPENEAFSGLRVLSILDCPKLMGDFSTLLLSLREFEILGCPRLVSFDGRMTIFDTKVDPPQQFCSLRELKISNMPNLKELSPSLDLHKLLPNLEKFEAAECPKMVSFPIDCLPDTLKQLRIGGTHNVSSVENLLHVLPNRRFMFHLHDSNFMYFPEGGLPAPTLTEIHFHKCGNLKSLPEGMHNLFPVLRWLKIHNCSEIECFPEGGLPSSLQSLGIRKCEKLVSSLREWGLQRLPSLISFELTHEGSLLLEDLQLPCSLRRLHMACLENLKDLIVLQHLTRLEYLCIWGFPKLQSLPQGKLPASLSQLSIHNCPKLQSLPKEGLPSSLSKLVIHNCPELQSLPEKRLPASLTQLSIYGCRLMKTRLECGKGEDWHKVAYIPWIAVDDELIP